MAESADHTFTTLAPIVAPPLSNPLVTGVPTDRIPHFALPLRIYGGSVVVHEQDEATDVVDCIAAIMRCPRGFRDEEPEFGIDDPTFTQGPVDVAALRHEVADWETRADTLMTENVDLVDAALRTIDVQVQAGG